MQLSAHRFEVHDLVSGHACLDLVNTVTARDSSPHDWLVDHAAMLEWAALTDRFDQEALAELASHAKQYPAGARRVLSQCKCFRELLHRVVSSLISSRAPSTADLRELDRFRIAAHKRMRCNAVAGRLQVQPTFTAARLVLITDTLVLEALSLLHEPPISRLRICSGTDCGWLFHDQSRGGQRRWCDMTTCGSNAKTRRFRSKATSHVPH